ncbi:Adamts12p [Mactra antiquata]
MYTYDRSGKGSCLETMSVDQHHQADFPDYEELNADKQCRLQFHVKSTACKPAVLCRELWCIDSADQCNTNSIPAANGTPCRNESRGFDGKCYHRECLPLSFQPQPVDGGWSQWSGYSECSRTCGGGVMNKQRMCNNPTYAISSIILCLSKMQR